MAPYRAFCGPPAFAAAYNLFYLHPNWAATILIASPKTAITTALNTIPGDYAGATLCRTSRDRNAGHPCHRLDWPFVETQNAATPLPDIVTGLTLPKVNTLVAVDLLASRKGRLLLTPSGTASLRRNQLDGVNAGLPAVGNSVR